MKRFENAVVLVTGGASGIGKATVERFVEEGAHIAIADYNIDGATKLSKELNTKGASTTPLFYDAGNIDSGKQIVKSTIEIFGTIDVLINNVGVTDLQRDLNILNLDIEYFDNIFHVNLRSMIVTTQTALPEMLKKGKGTIVNVASISGILGDFRGSLYGMTKSGVINLTRYIASQYGKHGIRCNSVSPGLVMTPAATGSLPPNIRDLFLKYNAVHYLGEPDDIAATIAYLASDDSRYVSGQNIVADGGMTCQNPTVEDMVQLSNMMSKTEKSK